jgi:hypothetical protein
MVNADPHTIEEKQQDAAGLVYLRRLLRAQPTDRWSRPSDLGEPPVKKSTTTESALRISNRARRMSPKNSANSTPLPSTPPILEAINSS